MLAAAQKIAADPGADPLRKKQAQQVVNQVTGYRQRRLATKQGRTARAQQRQARVTKQQQQQNAHALVGQLKRSLSGQAPDTEAVPAP